MKERAPAFTKTNYTNHENMVDSIINTTGWNNLAYAIALEAAFQITCEINSDNFNMYDRVAFLRNTPLFWQIRQKAGFDQWYRNYSNNFVTKTSPKESYPYVTDSNTETIYLFSVSLYEDRKKSFYDKIKSGDLELEHERMKLAKREKCANFSLIFDIWKIENGNKIKINSKHGADSNYVRAGETVVSSISWRIKKK